MGHFGEANPHVIDVRGLTIRDDEDLNLFRREVGHQRQMHRNVRSALVSGIEEQQSNRHSSIAG
jgi:hypothetical protein